MQGLAGLFTALAQQQQQGPGGSRALELLVQRAAAVAPASEVLSGIFGLPAEAAPGAAVQVRKRHPPWLWVPNCSLFNPALKPCWKD